MSQPQQSEKPKIFELNNMTLFTPVENKKLATMSFSIMGVYPRVTVFYPNPDGAPGRTAINAAFDLVHFAAMLDVLERTARHQGKTQSKIETLHWPREQSTGKITGDKEVSSEFWIGKDEEGICWMSIVAPNKPKLQFKILMSDYHKFYSSDGVQAGRGDGSVIVALSMARILRHHFIDKGTSFRDTSVPREKSVPYSQRGKQPAQGTQAGGEYVEEDVFS